MDTKRFVHSQFLGDRTGFHLCCMHQVDSIRITGKNEDSKVGWVGWTEICVLLLKLKKKKFLNSKGLRTLKLFHSYSVC